MLVICWVRTQTLIPLCLALNAMITSPLLFYFTFLEAAQSSKIIKELVSNITDQFQIIIRSMLWWRQDQKPPILGGKTSVGFIVGISWTEENDVIELKPELISQEVDQVSSFTGIGRPDYRLSFFHFFPINLPRQWP